MQPDYTLVIELAKDSDFSNCLLLASWLIQLATIILLDRNSLPSWLVNTFLDDCISALANSLTKVIGG